MAQELDRRSQAVQSILDYMQGAPDSFPHIDNESIAEMKRASGLVIILKPENCDDLMQSGLVDAISRDIDIPMIP